MIRKEKQNRVRVRSKILYILFALGLILWNSSVAHGRPIPTKKTPSSKTLRSMARIYMAYGEYVKAQPLVEKALSLAKTKGATDSELALCLIDTATLYKNQDKLADAEKMCEMGLKLQKKALYKNHPYVAYTLSTLSTIYCEQGKYYQSKCALDEAMTIMLDSHRVNDKAMIPFFVDIAKLHVVQGHLEEAESYYKKAMDLINNSYGPEHLYTANVLVGIAKLYNLQERYAKAEELINRALAVQEKFYGSDHHLIAASWLTKAKICQVKGDTIRAEKLINKALVAVEKTRNAAAFAKVQQDAKEIRLSKLVAYAPTE